MSSFYIVVADRLIVLYLFSFDCLIPVAGKFWYFQLERCAALSAKTVVT